MRTYEALYIISPEMDESGIQTVVTNVEALIANGGGTIVRSDVWGKRKLAYTIKKHIEGVYVVLRFEIDPDSIKRLEQQLKLMDPVIRYMVLYLDAQTLKLEEEQQRQYEEALRASTARRSGDDDDDDNDDGDERVPTRRRPEEDVAAEKKPTEVVEDKPAGVEEDKPAEVEEEKPAVVEEEKPAEVADDSGDEG